MSLNERDLVSPDLVSIDRLTVDYRRGGHWVNVIRNLSLTIAPGETLGLAGESGCGKSTLASLLLGERRSERRIGAGTIRIDGQDLFALKPAELRRLRRTRLAFVPQNGGTSLTPTMRIGRLFAETLRSENPRSSTAEIAEKARHYLAEVGLPDPAGALDRFPHQFSGGQQQRITLALALSHEPDLLILDEPTTGQDALTRRGIVEMLGRLRSTTRIAMLYVSHDIATLSELSDRIAIMYAGEIVEVGPVAETTERPLHPYARALIASVPRLETPPDPKRMLTGGLDRQFRGTGCRFAARCIEAVPECLHLPQALQPVGSNHQVACHRKDTIAQADGNWRLSTRAEKVPA